VSGDNEYGLQRPAQNVSVRVDSGVERVMIQSSQRPAAPQGAEYENPRGVIPRMGVTATDFGGDGNYQSASMYEPPRSSVNDDIINTAHTSARSFVPRSSLTPETLVRLPNGMQTTLKVAEREGFVRFVGGEWADARVASSQPQQAPQPQAPQQQEETTPVEFAGADAAQTFDAVVQQAPYLVDRTIANFFSADGVITEDTVSTFAQTLGLDRELAVELLQTQWTEWYGMAEEAVAREGVQDVDAFFAAIRADSEALKNSVYRIVHQRDASVFTRAARAWKKAGGK
jgi:hypothetical protein